MKQFRSNILNITGSAIFFASLIFYCGLIQIYGKAAALDLPVNLFNYSYEYYLIKGILLYFPLFFITFIPTLSRVYVLNILNTQIEYINKNFQENLELKRQLLQNELDGESKKHLLKLESIQGQREESLEKIESLKKKVFDNWCNFEEKNVFFIAGFSIFIIVSVINFITDSKPSLLSNIEIILVLLILCCGYLINKGIKEVILNKEIGVFKVLPFGSIMAIILVLFIPFLSGFITTMNKLDNHTFNDVIIKTSDNQLLNAKFIYSDSEKYILEIDKKITIINQNKIDSVSLEER